MIRLTIASAVAFATAALVAWRLGGAAGGGVLSGFLLGAGFSGLSVMYQRHTLMTAPGRALQVFALCFLTKLGLLLMGALAFRYIEEAAARADWRTFLVSFAAAVAVVLPMGLLDVLQVMRRGSAHGELPAETR